jgi:hypothetical protein
VHLNFFGTCACLSGEHETAHCACTRRYGLQFSSGQSFPSECPWWLKAAFAFAGLVPFGESPVLKVLSWIWIVVPLSHFFAGTLINW